MTNISLTNALVGVSWKQPGVIENSDGSFSKGYRLEPISSGTFEVGFQGPRCDLVFRKLCDLLTRMPNGFDSHLVFQRLAVGDLLNTKIFAFEKVAKAEGYSHLKALLEEIGARVEVILEKEWDSLLSGYLGKGCEEGSIPDVLWEKDSLKIGENQTRVLSLTEMPQITWQGCLQPLFEFEGPVVVSFKLQIPNREKIRRQLETKRRVSHALAIASSLEVRNIESNSVLSSSEETLERILVEKETLFEISMAVIIHGQEKDAKRDTKEIERLVSGIGNAGLYLETIGTKPVVKSHIPGNEILKVRKLPVLTENLAHLMPLFLDYSRENDRSHLSLRSRCGEESNLNLFSKENLNYNSFICGASGSGKSFLMNAILTSSIRDHKDIRLCIFDIGGSYRKIVEKEGGQSKALSSQEAKHLISTFLKNSKATSGGFYQSFLEALCGSGSHLTHSHKVGIDELIRDLHGEPLKIERLVELAKRKEEKYFKDIAHWLKPHLELDKCPDRKDLLDLIKGKVSSFDFKDLEGDPLLQKATILLLSNLIWDDLKRGKHDKTLIVFDEVWRFFAQSKEFLEEMYRTLRKYGAGIVSITQNLSDYGDEAFAKMLFTNSFTKIFLQNGADAEFLRRSFDMEETDVTRATSVSSKKPEYSEFFALSPKISQVYRLYPTSDFYELANTENIASQR